MSDTRCVVTNMDGRTIDWRADKCSYIGAVNPRIHEESLKLLE